ncbi:MAG: NAD-dependent epimerase/dehydratase family protein [Saprospiraceae bacterium]|nr:NAD-dependent epimerase/dehydratase family protein [Saprospiraceae bacterium]
MLEGKILIIGAAGQIGESLCDALSDKYGNENVIGTDIRPNDHIHNRFEKLDVLDVDHLEREISTNNITQIYHLAAILSAKGEQNPLKTWQFNMQSWFNVLEASRKFSVKKVFYPSSIAVYGDDAIKNPASQEVILHPNTVYGISKVAGENWIKYYRSKYDLDIRSLRFPGIIGYSAPPGGGTTDYAVDIFHQAIQFGKYDCFLKADTMLPMMYMDDAIRAIMELMDAKKEKIANSLAYNIAGCSFTPDDIFLEIKKHLPNFEINYRPDFRQNIADTWPQVIDDVQARTDWGWNPKFDLKNIVKDMLFHLSYKH